MQSFSCIILAGGRSSRMGSDKALLKVQQQCILLEHMINLALSCGAADLIVSRSPELRNDSLKQIVFVDDEYQHQGPLAGLHACLPRCQQNRVLVLPVDMPALSEDMLRVLLDSSTSACFKDYELPFLIVTNSVQRETLIRFITQQLESPKSRCSIRGMLNYLQVDELPITDEVRMLNTNSPEQWQQFLALQKNEA